MNANSIKFWTFFWNIGIFLLLPLEFVFVGMIPNVNESIFLFVGSFNFLAAGIDYIIASKFKLSHIYCINQKVKRQLVTYYPYEMDWKNNFDKKDMIKGGIIFNVIGLVSILTGLVIYFCG